MLLIHSILNYWFRKIVSAGPGGLARHRSTAAIVLSIYTLDPITLRNNGMLLTAQVPTWPGLHSLPTRLETGRRVSYLRTFKSPHCLHRRFTNLHPCLPPYTRRDGPSTRYTGKCVGGKPSIKMGWVPPAPTCSQPSKGIPSPQAGIRYNLSSNYIRSWRP